MDVGTAILTDRDELGRIERFVSLTSAMVRLESGRLVQIGTRRLRAREN